MLRGTSRTTVLIAATAIAMTTSARAWAAIPTTAPSVGGATTQPARDLAAVDLDLKRVSFALGQAFASVNITDPASRAAAAPRVVPLVKQQRDLFDEYAALRHVQSQMRSAHQRLTAMLYLFGDRQTVAQTDADAKSTVTADALAAQGTQLQARWLGAQRDASAQQPVADDLIKLDQANRSDDGLTALTVAFAGSAASPALKAQLLDMATKTMTSPTSRRMAMMIQRQEQANRTLSGLAGQPLTVTGTTVDGKPFSSAEYKGKVVLVDFWATWCGPCKAELPRVKDMYAKYHDKGLEIVGVSNDYTAGALRKYTAENEMPWVELLDAPAAADHQWNPVTLGYGILGIPTMFLIDKKGICRTVEARGSMEELIPRMLAE